MITLKKLLLYLDQETTNYKKTNYKVITTILLSWLLTLPITAIISAGTFKILEII